MDRMLEKKCLTPGLPASILEQGKSMLTQLTENGKQLN
jgi:hypothetical protein